MGLLDRLRGRFFKPTSLGRILDPAHDGLKRLSPRDLAIYKAGWREGTENWILADIEQRRREGWSGPVKLSLFMSGAALIISVAVALWNKG